MRTIDPLVAEYAEDFPDDELIVARCGGYELLIAVPKKKLRELVAQAKAENKPWAPPFWRHGEVLEVRPKGGEEGVQAVQR